MVQIRLHGLENGQATNDLLNEKRAEISEVGYCGYSRELKSKAGHVIIEICSERYDTVILIHCRDVTVMMNDDAK